MESVIKVLSANCQGLRNISKRADVLNYLGNMGSSILCLQETHWIDRDIGSIKQLWKGDCFINGSKTNARGVTILLTPNFEYSVSNISGNNEGNILSIDLKLSDSSLRIINVYAPNVDSPQYFREVENYITSAETDHILITGDLNLVLDPKQDSDNYRHINNPNARKQLIETLEKHNLFDVFRKMNPQLRRYTWRRKNPMKQARLDYFIASAKLMDIISSCQIKPGYRSDHSIIETNIVMCKFKRGKGIWKLNCSLLKDKDYLIRINNAIDEEKSRYTTPSTNEEMNGDNTISHSLLLEIILLRLRGESIKFSTIKKREKSNKEQKLIKDIETLEANNVNVSDLEAKKQELEKLREEIMQGVRIRSRVNWLRNGEKPSKLFCNLEKHNYTDKTVRRLRNQEGINIFDQKLILAEMKTFYERLFAKQKGQGKNYDLKKIMSKYNLPFLKEEDAKKLDGKLELSELHKALKNMKNEKSPGIDGFPAEFYKVFWGKLKDIILNAINESYDNGVLSTSLRHGLITCLPKGTKPREFIKNWRPITLLSVAYKIASAAIANRLKPVLEQIIPNNQTGFLQGRNISDCTRLVYDMLHYTEKENIPGLLLLVNFEKAFDSISWDFLNECMKILGFNAGFIQWINTFNNKAFASIIQCGYLSDPINIGRGCRQGDPIAPYLFILCSFFLTIMIDQNTSIKGIKFNNKEIKIIQFADDTSIFLDGSECSLQTTLNIIETYGSYSGLKMNKEKSELIWFGQKKHSKSVLCKESKLSWGATDFKLLGITFSTNLNEIHAKNYDQVIRNISKTILCWKKRILTPLGKITVLKTIIMSKFIHLFQSLPTPQENIVKKITKILFEFLWDGKPDKISRERVIQNKKSGGLEMIDLENFIKGLQVNWIKRLLGKEQPIWKLIIPYYIPSPEKLLYFGTLWPKKLAKEITNPFWLGVLKSWTEYISKYNLNLE